MLRQRNELTERFRYFEAKYREYRECFLMLRRRFVLIECAWCKLHIRWQRTHGAVSGDTSHSICQHCAADLLSTLPTAISPAPHQAVRDTKEPVSSPPCYGGQTRLRPSDAKSAEIPTTHQAHQLHRQPHNRQITATALCGAPCTPTRSL